MRRFLTSIGIENLERFDMDFDIVTRNTFNREQIDMFIIKETPWKYELLEEFLTHLESVKYPYQMKFSYIKKPMASDATKLFQEWHYSHCRYNSNLKVFGIGNTITIFYDSEEEKAKNEQIIKDYVQFLDFIGYNFKIDHKITTNSEEKQVISDSQKVNKEMNQDEERTLQAFQTTVTEMRHQMESNTKISQSWKEKIPYKKVDDISKLNEDSTNC